MPPRHCLSRIRNMELGCTHNVENGFDSAALAYRRFSTPPYFSRAPETRSQNESVPPPPFPRTVSRAHPSRALFIIALFRDVSDHPGEEEKIEMIVCKSRKNLNRKNFRGQPTRVSAFLPTLCLAPGSRFAPNFRTARPQAGFGKETIRRA